MAEENRPAYRNLRDGAAHWLTQQKISHLLPEVLPSSLYADASHPLTEGYEMLAKGIFQSREFQEWLQAKRR